MDDITPFSVCTHCGSDEFLRGPRGGACVNITCTECGARFNVILWPGLPMTLIDHLPPASPLELEAIRSSKRNQ